jgi:C4-dicarboxylate-specific signal transduction histidine kinase
MYVQHLESINTTKCLVTPTLIFVFADCIVRAFFLCRKSNIFDNMIAKLEKYSKNLEEIVEERTDQLREEKRKTDELLHQMLPVYVEKR